jgi:Outer membrane protein beta-barrel domain
MKKFFVIAVSVFFVSGVFAQVDTTVAKKAKPKVDLSGRANDHFMIQLGYAGWAGIPDTIATKGIAKTANVYFMFDFPFKTNPHFSIGIGAGVGTDNIYFDKTTVNIKDGNSRLTFKNNKDTSYFKKFKLSTAYLEAPVELRYTANPANSDKSFKFAIGAKVGTLLNVHTKGKSFVDDALGATLNYTQKESGKRFFNTYRLAVTSRIGYGNFSLFGSYQINAFVKDGLGPNVKPFSIGLTLSGL